MSQYVCEQCREEVAADAGVCPHCNYEPASAHRKGQMVNGVLGAICFFTVIGAPLGLWFFWKAIKHRKKRKTVSPAVEPPA